MTTVLKQKQNPLGYEPIGKLLLMFALPAVISMLVNAVYNIVDQIFIGQGVGHLGNAATTIAFPLMTIVLAVATLLGSGGSAYAAIKLGEKNEAKAEQTLSNVFILSLVMGIVMMVLGLVFLDPILTAFGASEQTMGYAKDYASVILLGVPFNVLGISLSNMARTDGSPKVAMYSVLVGAVLNTILDPIYIFVFDWGVTGAAIATITSQILSAVILIHYFMKKGTMRLHRAHMAPSLHICKEIGALGFSSCITQGAATIMQITMNNQLITYGNMTSVGGDVALSAMGIVMKISMIIGSICIGIGIGSQPILGFNKGADQPHRIQRTYITAVSIATAIVVVGWLACLLIPDKILALFGSNDPVFTAFAIRCMQVYLFGIFCAGFQIVSTSYFQATGQPVKASILSLLRQLLLLIPLLLILPNFFGLDGILYAGPVADMSSCCIVSIFVVVEMRKLNRHVKEKDAGLCPIETVEA